MKIHILFKFQKGPYGGGNQFLKALKQEFIKSGIYTSKIAAADVVLFNSFQNAARVIFYRLKYLRKIFVHRVDGPISLYRGQDDWQDRIIFRLNQIAADGTVYQSSWSREENHRLGMKVKEYETVIGNAADPKIFNKKGRSSRHKKDKIHLISVSWSNNWNKGFAFYKFLDENLDFKKYTMTFVGRSPIKFKNIKIHTPLTSQNLAPVLKHHDIFITASKNDPCSNSLIEALQCGLPAVFLKRGGHPEIVRHGGVGFANEKEMLVSIDKVARNLENYQKNVSCESTANVGGKYLQFFARLIRNKNKK